MHTVQRFGGHVDRGNWNVLKLICTVPSSLTSEKRVSLVTPTPCGFSQALLLLMLNIIGSWWEDSDETLVVSFLGKVSGFGNFFGGWVGGRSMNHTEKHNNYCKLEEMRTMLQDPRQVCCGQIPPQKAHMGWRQWWRKVCNAVWCSRVGRCDFRKSCRQGLGRLMCDPLPVWHWKHCWSLVDFPYFSSLISLQSSTWHFGYLWL